MKSRMISRGYKITLLLLIAISSGKSDADEIVNLPVSFPPPVVVAPSWLLLEFNSGWIVAGKEVNQRVAPASLTKLMTNYVVFEKLAKGQIHLQDQVFISEKSWRAEGSRMFAKIGNRIELQHLLKSTIIQSGNDAAIALAEHVAGSEAGFAAIMNQSAQKLGLTDSHFVNSTGLPDSNHYMSTADIAKLGAALIRDFPEFYPWYKEKRYTHNNITQHNRNKLLWKDPLVDGLKTGHTLEAGFCLAGTAQDNDVRWIAVVMGAENEAAREDSVMALLRYGFAAFEPLEAFGRQGGVTTVRVYKGEVDEVHLKSAEPAYIVVPAGQADKLETELRVSPYYIAPIEHRQAMGLASLSIAGQEIADIPLVTMSGIESGGWFKGLLDEVKLQIKRFRED